jgi:hypothetical protein
MIRLLASAPIVLLFFGVSAPAAAQDCGLDDRGFPQTYRQLTAQEAARCGGDVISGLAPREGKPFREFKLAVNCYNLDHTALRSAAISFLNARATGNLKKFWEAIKNEERAFVLSVDVYEKTPRGLRMLMTRTNLIAYRPTADPQNVAYVCTEDPENWNTYFPGTVNLKLKFTLAVSAVPQGHWALGVASEAGGVILASFAVTLPIKLIATVATGVLKTQARGWFSSESDEPPIPHDLDSRHRALHFRGNDIILKKPRFGESFTP